MQPPKTTLKPGACIYFVGVGGTGMAAVAGLCQEAGYRVIGSDAGVYPPMSTMLAELGIKVTTPYNAENVKRDDVDLFVIANVLSRGNAELEAVLASGKPYTSFPALLGDHFLEQRVGIIVTGTHGKTTTSSLMAHVLNELGEDPSFVIGGIPRNFPRSFRLGKGNTCVVEGDEYDTAFFDKGPKFLHYRPKHLILNNLEFDHADIYPNVEAIEAQFAKVLGLVADKGCVIANVDDPGIARVLKQTGTESQVFRVATLGQTKDADVSVGSYTARAVSAAEQNWKVLLKTKAWGDVEIETALSGRHNLANIAQVVGCLITLEQHGRLKSKIDKKRLVKAFATFLNVQRRLDHLGNGNGVDVYEDFAHHPTAVKTVIEGFRAVFPDKRLIIAFEPRSASQRRNVFQAAFADALSLADLVFIGECPVDQRIAEDKRMNTAQLKASIGTKAKTFATNAALLDGLKGDLRPGDAVIFMSSGSFSGMQHQLAKDLGGSRTGAK
jgi:UDP-N-acetylmuramate: L-alanyl-gamma-D-glutamyl-meso-diaminopimelate ligase